MTASHLQLKGRPEGVLKEHFVKQGDILGEGTFGVVSKVKDVISGRIFAMKEDDLSKVSRMAQGDKELAKKLVQMTRERDSLSLIHPFIVPVFAHFEASNILHILMEFCDGGTLAKHIAAKKARKDGFFAESEATCWLYQMASGVGFLHEKKVLHRDIKTDNFLLRNRPGDLIECVIGDFGVSKQLTTTVSKAGTFIGTVQYMAPELIADEPYSYKADIWSLGLVFYEVLTLEHPFASATNQLSMMKAIESKPIPAITTTTGFPESLRTLVGQSMLTRTAADRPSINDILQCPAMQAAQNLTERRRLEDQLHASQTKILDLETRLEAMCAENERLNFKLEASLSLNSELDGKSEKSCSGISMLGSKLQVANKVVGERRQKLPEPDELAASGSLHKAERCEKCGSDRIVEHPSWYANNPEIVCEACREYPSNSHRQNKKEGIVKGRKGKRA